MNGPSRASFNILFPLVLGVGVLYVARDFLIPIAVAILFRFLLGPLIQKLERLKIGRVASVLLVTLFAFSAIGGIGYIVGGQLIDLAEELPNYK
ncbi:MAG: AI-2E family transporter, partial [Chthoniobacteraceae bacterium]